MWCAKLKNPLIRESVSQGLGCLIRGRCRSAVFREYIYHHEHVSVSSGSCLEGLLPAKDIDGYQVSSVASWNVAEWRSGFRELLERIAIRTTIDIQLDVSSHEWPIIEGNQSTEDFRRSFVCGGVLVVRGCKDGIDQFCWKHYSALRTNFNISQDENFVVQLQLCVLLDQRSQIWSHVRLGF